MVENPSGPFQKHENNAEENTEEMETEETGNDNDNEEDFSESEEFQAIDNQLNMLNSVLDNLEQKNDFILAELTTLLKENREIRQQLQTSPKDNEHLPEASNK